ncbi:MAG: hypothetical protein KatS3mg015_0692 [Fimbriimonadales bacterium]|nr:MAG: hypothetical protein KatS3mg015_0692 [Fimbriimonadales bacterium]
MFRISLGLCCLGLLWGCGGGGGSFTAYGTREVRFQSAPYDNVPLDVETPDLNGQTDGATNFVRLYDAQDRVTVQAPSTTGGLPFFRWVWPGGYSTSPTITIEAALADQLTVVYGDGCTFEPNYVEAAGQLFYWSRMPVRVYFDESTGSPDAVAAAREGMQRWNDRLGGIIEWTEVQDASSANVVVRWDPDIEPPYVAYTTYTYDTGSGRLLSATIRILPSLDGDAGRALASHELGHALGISGHSPEWSDLMYSTYTGLNMQEVTLRDANTLRTAYCHLFGGSRSASPNSGETREVTVKCR